MWSSSALCPVCLADPEQCLCCSRTSSLRSLKPPYECTDQGFISVECCCVARCCRFFHFSCVATELFLRELRPFDRAAAWVGTFSTSAWQWPRSQSQALWWNCFPSLVWKNLPAQRRDLNPIQHLWVKLEFHWRARTYRPSSVPGFGEAKWG